MRVVGARGASTRTVEEGVTGSEVESVSSVAALTRARVAAVILVAPAIDVPAELAVERVRRVHGETPVVVAADEVVATPADAVVPIDADAVERILRSVVQGAAIDRERRRLRRIESIAAGTEAAVSPAAVCDAFVDDVGYDAAWVLRVDGETVAPVAASGVAASALRSGGSVHIDGSSDGEESDGGSESVWNRAIREGETVREGAPGGDHLLAAPFDRGCLVCTATTSFGDAEKAAIERVASSLSESDADHPMYATFGRAVAHEVNNQLDVAMLHADLLEHDGDEHVDHVTSALRRIGDVVDEVEALVSPDISVAEVRLDRVARDVWQTAAGDSARLETDVATVDADERLLRLLLSNLFRNAVVHGSANPTSTDRERRTESATCTESETSIGNGMSIESEASTGSRTNTGSDLSTGSGADTGSEANIEGPTSTGDGGADVTVSVGPLEGGGFYVEDDGVGFPDDAGERVFEWGYSASGGTGVGLALVSLVAERHGWSLDRLSEGGARIEFAPATTQS